MDVTRDNPLSPRATLHYAAPSTSHDRRWSARIAWGLCAYPWLIVTLLHVLYAVEWIVNAARPMPLYHGPDNSIERVLYASVAGTFMLAFPVAVVHFAAVLLANARALDFLDRFRPEVGYLKVALALLVPVACWVGAFVFLSIDPFDAFSFFVD